MARLPVFFINHGAPNQILDKNDLTTQFYKEFSKTIDEKIKAILIVSAHWEERSFHITSSNSKLKTIYDFYGFENELYNLKYNPSTSVDLISRLKELFKQSNVPLGLSEEQGLDHGAWTPLKMMYPNEDIPVVQLSLKSNLNGNDHYEMGKLLTPLRDEGYLIICSGSTLHNLGLFFRTQGSENSPIKVFEEWVQDTLTNDKLNTEQRKSQLLNYENAPKFRLAHPREEHFIPLIVAAGTGLESSSNGNGKAKMIHCNWKFPSFCLSCFRWD